MLKRLPIILGPVAFLVAVLYSTLATSPAAAYTLTGRRFDHVAITYDHPAIGEAVREWAKQTAIEDGGLVPTAQADIRLVIVDPWSPTFPFNVAGAAGTTKMKPGSSTIQLQGTVWLPPWNVDTQLGVRVHEVGHVLGLGHSSEVFGELNQLYKSATMFAWCCNTINADDRAGIAAIYGASTKPTIVAPTATRPATPTQAPTPTRTPPPIQRRAVLPGIGKDGPQ